MLYNINQVLQCSLNFYPLMNPTRIYLSLAKLLEIVEFPRCDELKRSKETFATTKYINLFVVAKYCELKSGKITQKVIQHVERQ